MRRTMLAALVGASLSLVPVAAFAAESRTQASPPADRNGVLHGCYVLKGKDAGRLRVLPPPARCPRGERAVTWSQAGPAGPAGPAGAAGAAGAPGPAGPSDLYSTALGGSGTTVGASSSTIISLSLPAGSYFIQGRAVGSSFACSVVTGSTTADTISNQSATVIPAPLFGIVTLTATATVSLQCNGFAGGSGTLYGTGNTLGATKLTALKVGATH